MFGHGTIRHFRSNASEMKKLAAQDFEDLLQVYITWDISYCTVLISSSAPFQFEGLLGGQHNHQLMKLLYHMSEWHALAKLQMHTEDSLVLMEEITKELGDLLCQFW